jgi:hypothetical protein
MKLQGSLYKNESNRQISAKLRSFIHSSHCNAWQNNFVKEAWSFPVLGIAEKLFLNKLTNNFNWPHWDYYPLQLDLDSLLETSAPYSVSFQPVSWSSQMKDSGPWQTNDFCVPVLHHPAIITICRNQCNINLPFLFRSHKWCLTLRCSDKINTIFSYQSSFLYYTAIRYRFSKYFIKFLSL